MLPAHSPLGASSAKRWMECAGSATLIRLLMAEGSFDDQDEDWRRDGIQAHELAAHCLNASIDTWEAEPEQWPELSADMMAGVQVYLNYVRAIRGYNQRFIEYKLHRSEFHPWCYGTVDCAVQDRKSGLEVIDYKHGVGVVVEVENNPQLMYYAFMVIDELGDFADEEPVKLTIVQPRITWINGGEPRSWETTVGYIKTWAIEVLRPAMEQTALSGHLATGEHCRFCPAKLVCPAFLGTAKRLFSLTLDDIKKVTEQQLAELLPLVPIGRMALTALVNEAKHRTVNDAKCIPGWKLVHAMADRIWKDGAPVAEQFGYQPQKVLSPAAVEKEPGGKAFVAEYAFRPDAGYDLVPESDRRKEVILEPGSETFKKALDLLGKKD
jgi:hypothetical protein